MLAWYERVLLVILTLVLVILPWVCIAIIANGLFHAF